MATLAQNISDLATAIGTDVKDIYTKQGVLGALNTTNQSNLVAAINEVYAIAAAATGIDDGVTVLDHTWSSSKIYDQLEAYKTAAINAVTAGAGAALDTLNELAAALGNDANFATTTATALGKRVRVDAAQSFTTGEKLQGCNNLGIGDPETLYLSIYQAAKA